MLPTPNDRLIFAGARAVDVLTQTNLAAAWRHCLGNACELLDGQRLGACLRGYAGLEERGLRGGRRSGETAERGAQGLAALGEPGVDDREHLIAGRPGDRRRSEEHTSELQS